METKSLESQLDEKLTVTVQLLCSKNGFICNDDTLFTKLQTAVAALLTRKADRMNCAVSSGLLSLCQQNLDCGFISDVTNVNGSLFAMGCLSALIEDEKTFEALKEHKVLVNFLIALPVIRLNIALALSAVDLMKKMAMHRSGQKWLFANGIWEHLLLPCLRSNSIFVQKKTAHLIVSLTILKASDEEFTRMTQDLNFVMYKMREMRYSLYSSPDDNDDGVIKQEMYQGTLAVLGIFAELLTLTLGKTALYTQLENSIDLTRRVLERLNFVIYPCSANKIVHIIFIHMLHKFQEKILLYGTVEQYLLVSLCQDLLSLVRHLCNKGHHLIFLRMSFSFFHWWSIFVSNLRETKDTDLSKCTSLVFIMLRLHMVPLLLLCYVPALEHPFLKTYMGKYTEEFSMQMKLRADVDKEVALLEQQYTDALNSDRSTLSACTLCLLDAYNGLEYLPETAVLFLYRGVAMLLLSSSVDSSPLNNEPQLQKAVLELLTKIIQKHDFDWQKHPLHLYVLEELWNMLGTRSNQLLIKVSILQTFNAAVQKMLPAILPILIGTDSIRDSSIEQLGMGLEKLTLDTEWEVRDSALELILTCMKLGVEKYSYFIDWALRNNIISTVTNCLADPEFFVQATALQVVRQFVLSEEMWINLDSTVIKVQVFQAVLQSGDPNIRRAAMGVLHALLTSGRLMKSEMNEGLPSLLAFAFDDSDEEVRLQVIHVIMTHILHQFRKSGMVDGDFPVVTFAAGKIKKLDEVEIKERVVSVISWVCSSGYLHIITLCLRDPVEDVYREAHKVVEFLGKIVSKYDLTVELLELSKRLVNLPEVSTKEDPANDDVEHMQVSTHQSFPSSENIAMGTESQLALSPLATPPLTTILSDIPFEDFFMPPHTPEAKDMRDPDQGIEDVLRISDLQLAGRIKRDDSSTNEWWNVDPCRIVRQDGVVGNVRLPFAAPAQPPSVLLEHLAVCSSDSQKDTAATLLKEFSSLLEDLQLSMSVEEAELRDCY